MRPCTSQPPPSLSQIWRRPRRERGPSSKGSSTPPRVPRDSHSRERSLRLHPLNPTGGVPVPLAHQGHHGGDDVGPHDHRVDEDREEECEAELLEEKAGGEREGPEGAREDYGGRGDYPTGVLDCGGYCLVQRLPLR